MVEIVIPPAHRGQGDHIVGRDGSSVVVHVYLHKPSRTTCSVAAFLVGWP